MDKMNVDSGELARAADGFLDFLAALADDDRD
jgi:hypothetical protein